MLSAGRLQARDRDRATQHYFTHSALPLRVRHLVVRENGTVLGVVSVGDMVKFRLSQLEMETAVLRDYLAAQRASR